MARRKLDSARAIVTGASSGIGRALAIELARRDVRLVLVARSTDALEQTATAVAAVGPAAELVVGDITDAEVRAAALQKAKETLGGLDLLVNNAGVSAHGRFADASPERLRDIFEVNFFAAVELMRAALPLLREGREPIVVNVGSILGRRAIPHNSEYCASKFAMQGFSEAIRPELAREKIDLLMVNPGTTDTNFFEHLLEQTGEIPWKQGRGVRPERVAQATVQAICRRRNEIIPSKSGWVLVWLNRLSPRLVDWWMKRYG